ncbi:MAG: hypothetical protein HOC70_07490 [Gammaproteobacteria bacterium]|jgi:hypothetical protein|nr:hypothetical protein [Gammaproteobacteria bacterium]MBT4493072.1 hypothetical protein [Gammaproteobacteria bacterium]
MFTLEDLGNLGEFVAAIGVVVSFFYLAFQIRQNTRSLKANAYQETNSYFQQIMLLPSMYPHMAKLLAKSDSNLESLSDEDWAGLGSLYHATFSAVQTMMKAHGEGMVDDELWYATRDSVKTLLGRPSVEFWWANFAPSFTSSFKAEVEQIRTEIGST